MPFFQFFIARTLPDWRIEFSLHRQIAAIVCSLLVAGSGHTEETILNDPEVADGILPSLSSLWLVPESLRLRYPDQFEPGDALVDYSRKFPLFAQEAIDRGFLLPKPYGLSIVGVKNVQEQFITNLSVALGKGSAPPQGTELRPIPFVTINDAISDTDSLQIKADFWLLPNVNLFGVLGRVEGTVNLDVLVDLDEFLPPPVCRPANPCGTARANFDAGVNTNSMTLGATVVHGWENWFASGTISGTASFGENTDTTIRSWGASGRFGRRWAYGRGNMAAPYIGVSYFDLDQTVEGVTRLPDAFPDGESLEVRYRAKTENRDKWAAIVGLNLGYSNGVGVNLELNQSENSQRLVLGTNVRF